MSSKGTLRGGTYAKCTKFNKIKYKVLHPHWDNPKHNYRLEDGKIERSPEEKDMRMLMDEKLSMAWKCALAAQEANHAWAASTAAWATGTNIKYYDVGDQAYECLDEWKKNRDENTNLDTWKVQRHDTGSGH
ncbi:hypothetical protein BTVI_81034 [Pitangus sulphuratus]|nr:hypothetical protein BTVI_81034 [Pitangus sulphuratus]